MSGLFISATDTDVGKTVITGAIAAAFKARGLHVGVMKPLASGAVLNAQGELVAEDASFLMMAAGIEESERHLVNPVCLAPALTPAVAATLSGVDVNMAGILENYHKLAATYDPLLVEGVGGLIAPLWKDYLLIDLMVDLALPVIIVTRPNLGTINHTVLTVEYARQRGVKVIGIIINGWNEAEVGILERSNEGYMAGLTGVPILGKFPYVEAIRDGNISSAQLAEFAEEYLEVDEIIKIMEDGHEHE